MEPKVTPIPKGYHAVTPYLCVNGGAAAIAFYKAAFAATEVSRLDMPDGRVGHAEVQIGDSRVMLSDEFPEVEFRSPRAIGGSPVMIHVYLEDVDATLASALAAGAKQIRPLTDQFYGDRTTCIEDPFGHTWYLATRKENVSHEEMERRMKTMGAGT
jgi:PhnB protein